MGILDNARAAVSRGTATAERTTRKLKLQAQVNDVNKRRQGLAAQLGASLYEATKNDENLRSGRKSLFDGIAACDEERASLLAQIASLDAEAAAEQSAARFFVCGVCGARVSEADMFCSGCGTPAAQAKAAAQSTQVSPAEATDGPACSSCGAAISADDMFCMSCGAPVVQAEAATQATQATDQTTQATEVIDAPTCPSCGAAIAADDMFCMGCGTKLAQEA